jgi:serine protease
MSRRLALLLVLVLLVACDELFVTPSSRTGGTISGTITLGGTSASQETSDEVVNLNDQTAPIVPGEVIVRFVPGLRAEALSSLNVQGNTLKRERSLLLENTELYKVEGLSQTETYDLAETLKTRPDIEDAVPNFIYEAFAKPNDTYYDRQWHYPAMNLPAAWDISKGSANVVVAVIDTGILTSHPDFAGRLLPGYDFVSDPAIAADGDGQDNDPTDSGPASKTLYHGTHVAGTIGAASNNGVGVAGVDWNAKILPVRALGINPDPAKNTSAGTLDDLLDATLWAAGISDSRIADVPKNDHPADVLNFSLGGAGTCNSFLQTAFDRVVAEGKVIVVAAGNATKNATSFTPGNCRNVITVGATNRQGDRAYYSNYGSRIDVMAPGGESAPDAVLSLGKDDVGTLTYTYLSGTSMAAPHVAGLVALMKALKPDITHTQVLQFLTATARSLNATQCRGTATTLTASDCGAGLVDAGAALAALRGVDLSGTLVGVCVLDGEQCRAGTIVKTVVSGSGSSVTYLLNNLSKNTTYALEAYKDTNNNNVFDAGDYYAFTENVRPSATVNLSISLYRGSSSMRFLNVTSPR